LIDVEFEEDLAEYNDTILRIAADKKEIKARRFENFKLILAVSQQIDQLGRFVAPAPWLEEAVEKPKAVRSKQPTEVKLEAAQTQANEEGVEAVAANGNADALSGPAEQVKHPCHICEDDFYHKVDLVKHLRIHHGLNLAESVNPAPIRSICAECISPVDACGIFEGNPIPILRGCPEHATKLNADQVLWRNTTCQEWRNCPFQSKCFGPSNEEDPTCFKEDKIRELGTAALASLPVDSHMDRHNKLVAERRAAGDDINDHGVYLNAEIITIPIPPKAKHDAAIEIAVNADGEYCYGYDFKCRASENIEGCSGAPSISGPFFASREDAVLAALAFLTTRWPNKKIPGRKVALECVNAYYMQTVKQAAAALPVFRCLNIECEFNNFDVPDSCNEPDRKGRPVDNCCDYSSIPVAPKEQPKQEVAQPVDESPAQASEVAKCRNNDCDYFDNFMPDYCTKLALGEPVPVTDCKDYQAMWPQDREQPKPYAPEDCDDCGNRGILDGTDDYCNCPHGVRARKADQAELERRKERKKELAEVVQVDELQPATFSPLDEPLGDCDQCMGYGVVEGELFGESTFIPCRCEAGIKVAGDKWTGPVTDGGPNPNYRKCCEECNIDDPDCASCNLPDLEASAKVEPVKCANGSCTATGKDAKVNCLDPVKGCKNFVPVENCTHHMLKRSTAPDGSTVCDLCGFVLRTAEREVERVAALEKETEPPKPALTPLQLKCTHPSVFRQPVDGGFYCKCCKQTILSGGGGRDCLPFSLVPPTGFE